MSNPRLILHFPGMHPETVTPEQAPGVLCLNPGLDLPGDGKFTPEKLPLDRKSASAWLSQALGFGGQFKRLGDLSALGSARIEDFYEGTSNSIRSQLMGYGGSSGERAPDPVLAAQMTLLLAFNAERGILDSMGAGKGLQDGWQRFRGSLGLSDDEDGEAGAAGLPADSRLDLFDSELEEAVPWKPVLDAFLKLAPVDAYLFVDRPDIIGDWLEAGLPVEYPPRDQWGLFHPEWPESLPGRLGLLRAAGRELLGLTGGQAESLSAVREVLLWTYETG